ncbi:MAG: hypothetical protein INR65_08455 [Gluconacetobacter diazotrophicus]|nr:hypothetical protein [Gluconacetobacter diazotrophicus]
MPLIYSGDVLALHHNPGDTPFLLVTFMGAFAEHSATTTYQMREIVEKEGIACAGVTNRVRNMYVHPEIEAVIERIRALRRPDQKVIVLGQSLGGFAAIKYADRLGADQVIAFSPIFSLDETDLGLSEHQTYELAILRGAIRFHRVPLEIVKPGMRPGPEDCSAPLLITYDIGNANDSFAAARYAEVLPTAHMVRIKNMGHATFNRLEEGQSHFLPDLLKHLAAGDQAAAARMLLRLSRNSEAALVELMIRLARWRPETVAGALRTPRARTVLKDETRRHHQYNDILVYEFIRRGRLEAAVSHLRGLHQDLFRAAQDGADAASRKPGLFLAISFHGDLLKYDLERKEVICTPSGLHDRKRVPAIVDLRRAVPRLIIQTRSGERPVVADRGGRDDTATALEVVPINNEHHVAFRRDGAFLRTDFNSTPVFVAEVALDWEYFALVPIPDPAALSRATGMNWFDGLSLPSPDAAPPTPGNTPGTSPPPRKTAFRSVLQRFFAG